MDRSAELIAGFRRRGFDALIGVGGDGTRTISHELWKRGLPIVGVPKTIDNDVGGTVVTFGFDTAVQTATDGLDKVHSTAEAHQRVLVVEVMGRHAGWIALNSGLAGGADVILMPEIPFDLERVCDGICEREALGRHFSIVVVAEGAVPRDDTGPHVKAPRAAGGLEKLGGVGEVVAREITERTGKETRSLTLGHLQRGGSPTTFDRILALRFGAAAEGRFGGIVALDSDIVATARDVGISLGD